MSSVNDQKRLEVEAARQLILQNQASGNKINYGSMAPNQINNALQQQMQQPTVQQTTMQSAPSQQLIGQTKSASEIQAMRDAITKNQQQSSVPTGTNTGYDVSTGQWRDAVTKQSSDTTNMDPMIAQVKQAFSQAEVNGDIAGMVQAAQQADQRRMQLGQPAINQALIQRLQQQSGNTGGIPPIQQSGQPQSQQTPPVSYDQNGVPLLNMPQYGQFQSPYQDQIKQMLDQIANTPAYESPYAGILQSMINKISTREFDYNADSDPEFQRDSRILSQAIMEQMNARGILNSSITADSVSQTIKDLMVDYSGRAYQRFMDEGQQLLQQANFIMGVDEYGYNRYQGEKTQQMKMLDFMMGLDDREYSLYKDARDMDYQMRKDQYESSMNQYNVKQRQIETAWNKVRELGYVDNETSIILGVEPGTLSRDARIAEENRIASIQQSKIEAQSKLDDLEMKHAMAVDMELLKQQHSAQLQSQKTAEAAQLEQLKASLRAPTVEEIKNLSPSQIGTKEQVAAYNYIKQYALDESDGDASGALEVVLTMPELRDAIGGGLFNRLVSDLEQLSKVQGVDKDPKTNASALQLANYKEISQGLSSEFNSSSEALRYMDQIGKQTYIDLVGKELYDQLIKDVGGSYDYSNEDTMGAIYSAMMNSDNPLEWFKEEAGAMTGSELDKAAKWLKDYVKLIEGGEDSLEQIVSEIVGRNKK